VDGQHLSTSIASSNFNTGTVMRISFSPFVTPLNFTWDERIGVYDSEFPDLRGWQDTGDGNDLGIEQIGDENLGI